MKMAMKKRPKYYVPAVAKTLVILETLAASERPMTLQGLTEQTRLPKSSVYAILATLETHQYVERDVSGLFRLGAKVSQIAAPKHAPNLSRFFHQAARTIVEECGETVQLAILDQIEVIYVAREDGTQPVQLVSHIGKRLPAHATGLGKVLLAAFSDESLNALYAGRQLATLTPYTINSLSQLKSELRLVRSQGFAHDNQESAVGLECLAAPIYDQTGQIVAAMSASFLSARADAGHSERIQKLVMEGAREISQRMGWNPADEPSVIEPAAASAGDSRPAEPAPETKRILV